MSSRFVRRPNDALMAQACPSSACWHFVPRLQDGAPDSASHPLVAAHKTDVGGGTSFCISQKADFQPWLIGGNWLRPSLSAGEPGTGSPWHSQPPSWGRMCLHAGGEGSDLEWTTHTVCRGSFWVGLLSGKLASHIRGSRKTELLWDRLSVFLTVFEKKKLSQGLPLAIFLFTITIKLTI